MEDFKKEVMLFVRRVFVEDGFDITGTELEIQRISPASDALNVILKGIVFSSLDNTQPVTESNQ